MDEEAELAEWTPPEVADEILFSLPDLMTVPEVCAALKISRSTLYAKLQADPDFPRPIKLGALTRWRESDLEQYLQSLPIAEYSDPL